MYSRVTRERISARDPPRCIFTHSKAIYLQAATLQLEDFSIAALEQLGLGPLISSVPVSRLSRIHFMGLLGRTGLGGDQTRFEHSLGVAILAAHVLERVGAPVRVIRHAAAAALLHDASQWALSHSCEGAFAHLTGFNNGQITQAMIFDSSVLPAKYHLGRLLEDLDLDRESVWCLLKKSPESADQSRFWKAAADLFACPLNPDTIDGIARACAIFGVDCPLREDVADCLEMISGRLSVRGSSFGVLDAFWKSKDEVYSGHIHNSSAMLLELQYSLAVTKAFPRIPLEAALDLTDDMVLEKIGNCLPEMSRKSIAEGYKLRFRRPRRYTINSEAWAGDPSVPVVDLDRRYLRVLI